MNQLRSLLCLIFTVSVIISQDKEKNDSWIDKQFPIDTLTDLNGKIFTTSMLKGNVVLINFWFTKCKPCVKEIPDLNKLMNYYQDKDVLFLAPTFNKVEDLEPFLDEHKFAFPIFPEMFELIHKLDIYAFPTNIILNKKGIIKDILVGAGDGMFEMLKEKIDQQLNEKI